MPSILLLGSGFVAQPTLHYLARKPENEITVACRHVEKAKSLIGDLTAAARPIALDVTNQTALEEEVGKHNLVVSLIPYTAHPMVIRAAIKHGVNVVTTSYVSPAMLELESDVKRAGIVVMNEIGLDPGIDHLYAVKAIDDIHREGGQVRSFLSYCGGLPAPEDSNNPLGYKFSWSSRGVLLALRNASRFWQDGKIVDIEGPDLMASAKPYFIYPGFAFVAYPNRDSTGYKARYNIPEAETVVRGTLRYQGFPEFVRTLTELGFLSESAVDYLQSGSASIRWKDLVAKITFAKSSEEEDLIQAIYTKATFKSREDGERIVAGLRWLGLLSDDFVKPKGNLLDTLCAVLEEKMQYGEDERDMCMLQHKFYVTLKDGTQQVRTSTLLDFGTVGGYSSMARLVGIPCGVACQQVLDGVIATPGILAPVTGGLVYPLIKELKAEGIECKEEIIA